MKLLNADKLVEFIENNKEVEYDNFGKKVSCKINDDDLLSFISTNSIEADIPTTSDTNSDKLKEAVEIIKMCDFWFDAYRETKSMSEKDIEKEIRNWLKNNKDNSEL
jgi:hypothetical protein